MNNNSVKINEKESNGLAYLNTIYRVGQAHFDAGNYEQSLSIFRFLCLSQPTRYEFFLALAIIQIKLNRITNAISTLSYAYTLPKRDPQAALLLAKLLLKQNKHHLAKQAADIALKMSMIDNPQWKIYNNKAKAILDQLDKK